MVLPVSSRVVGLTAYCARHRPVAFEEQRVPRHLLLCQPPPLEGRPGSSNCGRHRSVAMRRAMGPPGPAFVPVLVSLKRGAVGRFLLRPSSEHILIVRAPGAGESPNCPAAPSEAAHCPSTGISPFAPSHPAPPTPQPWPETRPQEPSPWLPSPSPFPDPPSWPPRK